MRIDVLGVGFDDLTMAEAVAAGARLLTEEGCHYVVTPNPEIVEVCRENPEAMKAVNGAEDPAPCDSIPRWCNRTAAIGTPPPADTPPAAAR